MNNIHTFVILAYKESKYLEECIKSVLNQSVKTNVVIATSTPNNYIKTLAKKYGLDIIINKSSKGIGYDFDFAINSSDTNLVTIAHQDDIYENNYAEFILNYYQKYNKSIIVFSDYYEIRNNKKIFSNRLLRIKRLLLFPLRIRLFNDRVFIKRLILKFGNSICCPAVTFVKDKCPKVIFSSDFKCNVDWYAWEKLSKIDGSFTFISRSLMGHRINEETTTTSIINNGIRSKEDLIMYEKFWGKRIARFLNKFYTNAQKSNSLK